MSNNPINHNLPWGWDAYYVGDADHPQETKTASTAKCECGTTITLGKEDSPELHQHYCVVFKEYEATNKRP